jgi:hypothetical protein
LGTGGRTMTYEQWIKEVSKTTYLFEAEKKTEGPYNPNPYNNKMKDLFYQSPEEEEAQQEI